MRGPSHGPTFSMPGESFNAWRSSVGSAISGLGAADGGKAARKGSIRNAVRRIFGRKRRTIAHIPEESASGLSVVPGHTYHQKLRRRVTLPSVQAEEEQAEHDKDPIDHATNPARAVSRTSFRQSDVMRTSGFYNHNPTQKETVEQDGESEAPEEPVYAQDEPSQQPEKSNHHLAPPPMDHIPCTDIPVRGGSLRSTGSQYATADELNQHSSPDRDHESDHPIDLESRIANLEAGLSSFQTSLNRLTSSRNRRTIVVGQASNPRSPTSDRTPSMLADTLDPFTQEYEYIKALHPTSPHGLPPTHPESLFNHPPNKALPLPQVSPTMKEFPTPPRSTNHHTPSNSHSSPTSPTQAHTFRSLYLMLSTERSERRKLESDLRSLQGQVQDLTARLSVTSNHSQHLGPNDTERGGEGDPRRSSYLLIGSSARLQQLLDETDSYPESSPSPSLGPSSPSPSLKMKRSSGVLETGAPAVMMSRFSGSESELGVGVREMDFGISSEGETPFETPGEERVGYNFDYGGGDWQVREREVEADMF
ncbi:uncharacterized protein MYCGRDRAFT_90237 [Zymoseptoria tritici IPO323]|uniref:Uncharacterized protein n=1 Tax=Zymoseptoria tritici (strain CBS 115943 / IPO323) TaxID=336722 RepID=F9WX69_ZYMTI|nr:uncharacterized protein MYCGRDRAFT_90237 [Zymoseptoria tritici IPO323]EGP91862.1 hypothetical protein MYCGRDRAFT_90237 [Zymoseptoria tritici IPO323]